MKTTVNKKALYEGYEALLRLAKQRDEKGMAWPIRIAYPISENLIKLQTDYKVLADARKSSAESLVKKALELAVRDGKGNPLPKGNGYVLRDPNAYREAEHEEEEGWQKKLAEVMEVEVLQIKASDLVTVMGGEANTHIDAEDLALLRKLGVLHYDLDGAKADEKK